MSANRETRWEVARGLDGNLHVLPLKDTQDHDDDAECWCHPTPDDDGIIVHHSLDRRELH